MAKWEFRTEKWSAEGSGFAVRLERNGILVGSMGGFIKKLVAGPKYFKVSPFSVAGEYQQEYMETHNGLKMGEAIGLEILNVLKKKGISHIRPYMPNKQARKFIERIISAGLIERPKRLWEKWLFKINWEKLPATEEAGMEMIREIRMREAQKRTVVEKVRGILRRPFHRRPR